MKAPPGTTYPHARPCFDDESPFGNECFPKINTIRIVKSGPNFDFILGNVPAELLPKLEETAPDQAQVEVKQASPGFDVTISAMPHAEAADLLKRLHPNDLNAKLPE